MFSRFARPIDLRNTRTPRPLGVGIGSIGFPDNGMGDITYDFNQITVDEPTPTPSSISLNLSQATTTPAASTPGITGQDWAQIIGASTAGLMNVIGAAFSVDAARQAAKQKEWALKDILTGGGAVAPAAGVGIGLGTVALVAGAGFVIYMLIRRRKS